MEHIVFTWNCNICSTCWHFLSNKIDWCSCLIIAFIYCLGEEKINSKTLNILLSGRFWICSHQREELADLAKVGLPLRLCPTQISGKLKGKCVEFCEHVNHNKAFCPFHYHHRFPGPFPHSPVIFYSLYLLSTSLITPFDPISLILSQHHAHIRPSPNLKMEIGE